uniref:Uncharacterized protein n=1 Tax=Glossina pallidipes TaxID=7398 RepID=A0A1A9Z1E4_GLOPL
MGNGYIQNTYMVLPQAEFIQLRFISGQPDCDYTINANIPDLFNIRMRVIDYYENKFVKTTYGTPSHSVRITTETNGCLHIPPKEYDFKEAKPSTIFLQPQIAGKMLYMHGDQVQKCSKTNPLIRNLVNLDGDSKIVWRSGKVEKDEYRGKIGDQTQVHLHAAHMALFSWVASPYKSNVPENEATIKVKE